MGYRLDRRHACPCPVHKGKDANFHVKNGVGTCFSQCGRKTWDAVGLVMEVQQLTYPEALEWMASKANMTVEYAGSADRSEYLQQAKQERDLREKIYDLNAKVLALWQARVGELKMAERYDLDGRDWSGETIAAFGLVITPTDNTLVQASYDGALNRIALEEAGLIRPAEAGGHYDFFRERLIFPMYTEQGKLAGFSGRKMRSAKPDAPKYKNSPEGAAFQKRRLLYGLWQNRRTIQQNDRAVLVEGMADVATCYDGGLRQMVASGGTAVTQEQLRLLKRYTRNVTIMLDADEAGMKAAMKAVEDAVLEGLSPSVCFFDDVREDHRQQGIQRYDPDNFVRAAGADALAALLDAKTRDGLVWRVMLEWHPTEIFKQVAAVKLAARLLSVMEDEMVRTHYVTELCKAEYMGKAAKAQLTEAITEEREQRLREQSKPKLTPQQVGDVVRYGLYVKNNQYWKTSSPEAEGYPITNFVINPVMLVVGSQASTRLVEIVNVFGQKFTSNINSDAFVEMSTLKKEVERRGNFLFLETATPSDFTKIKRKLYEDMKTCYPITTMGWHTKMLFWAWANGIYTTEGQWLPVDEHGVVTFKETKFFLQAFAQVNEEIMSDDQDNSFEDTKNFLYVPEIPAPSFERWTQHMTRVHGPNGMIAVAWYLAAVYRDIIYSKFEFFPHLNLFGPPGTGKSFLGWSISYLFGKARRPFNLHEGTEVGFFRRMAQARNSIAWYDEYNNDINPKRAQGLKNAYDGAGREKGVASSDNRTVTTQVNSALIISGQTQPTQDIALFTRTISLNFRETSRTPEAERAATELRTIEQTGCLSQITAMLQRYRGVVEADFDQCYDDIRRQLAQACKAKNRDVLDRLYNNYSIPMAVALALKQHLPCSFGIMELYDAMLNNLLLQADSISQEDDLAIWWQILEYYVEKKELVHNQDLIVQETTNVTVRDPMGKATDTMELKFGEKRKVLFLRFTKVYRFYSEQLKREGKSGALNQEAVKYYLRSSTAFLGEVRAKKFNGETKACYAFDMGKLAFDLAISSHVDEIESPI